jgi:hypothetical protein
MAKPTETELQQAIVAAIHMRESNNDPDFIAKSLLNLNYRVQRLERVMTAARSYLHAGQSISDHRRLMQTIQAAEKAGAETEGDDMPILGHAEPRAH